MKALDEYVEVHVRVGQFWEQHPTGRIETAITYPDENTVRCQAWVYRSPDESLPAATGHAEEKRDVGMVNKTSATENCETSAVGRALALLGFSIHKGIASREEVEIARRKAAGAAEKPSNGQDKPALDEYVEWLRNAVQTYDKRRHDDAAWKLVRGSDPSPGQLSALVSVLKAELRDLGADVEAIDGAFLRRHEMTKSVAEQTGVIA